MKGGKQYGAFGAVTLEKAKLDISQRKKKIIPEVTNAVICIVDLNCKRK
jgi:hypothetical protein